MGQAERTQVRPEVAGHASARYGAKGVPADWFLDPADPAAAERYRTGASLLEDQATEFLAAHAGPPGTEARTSALRLVPTEAPDVLDDDIEDLDDVEDLPAEDRPVWSTEPLVEGMAEDDGELSWQADSLCAQTDPEAFFPEKGGSTRDAKKVCGACIVKSQCLAYALENDERFGIWGGLSERERRRLRRSAV